MLSCLILYENVWYGLDMDCYGMIWSAEEPFLRQLQPPISPRPAALPRSKCERSGPWARRSIEPRVAAPSPGAGEKVWMIQLFLMFYGSYMAHISINQRVILIKSRLSRKQQATSATFASSASSRLKRLLSAWAWQWTETGRIACRCWCTEAGQRW